jgi:hypothetical protein
MWQRNIFRQTVGVGKPGGAIYHSTRVSG